jgi:hypothetical protein
MATTALSVENPTIVDVVKLTQPDGSVVRRVAELLSKRCPIMGYLPMIEGNLPTGHRVTSRTGLPSLGWRSFNEGVAASKSKEDTYDESCGMLEGRSVVDVELANLNGNAAAFRAKKDMAFIASFKHELETGIFYHSTKTAPEKFMGLSPRHDSLTGANLKQVINCQVSSSGSDQASVWMAVLGEGSVYGIYPRGTDGGLKHHDMGVQLEEDSAGNRFRAYVTVWNQKFGLVVEDHRQVVRICNIDTSAIVNTGKLLLEDMITGFFRLYDRSAGRVVVCMNSFIAEKLHQQWLDTGKASGLNFKNEVKEGEPIGTFMGAPILITDALLNTEAIVA